LKRYAHETSAPANPVLTDGPRGPSGPPVRCRVLGSAVPGPRCVLACAERLAAPTVRTGSRVSRGTTSTDNKSRRLGGPLLSKPVSLAVRRRWFDSSCFRRRRETRVLSTSRSPTNRTPSVRTIRVAAGLPLRRRGANQTDVRPPGVPVGFEELR
jgi:hypothetical protein